MLHREDPIGLTASPQVSSSSEANGIDASSLFHRFLGGRFFFGYVTFDMFSGRYVQAHHRVNHASIDIYSILILPVNF